MFPLQPHHPLKFLINRGFWLGLMVFFSLLVYPKPETLSLGGWQTIALALLMAIWWITEALPLAVTALVPIAIAPFLQIGSIDEMTKPYANPIVFLAMGGFIMAVAMQKWNLHQRIALTVIDKIGHNPKSIILSFLLSASLISMFVSNTATTLMLLPIALSIIHVGFAENIPDKEKNKFTTALILGIAYSASIGGMCTLIGTATNTYMAAFMRETYQFEIGFARWLLVGIPLAIIALPFTYFLLTRWVFPLNSAQLNYEQEHNKSYITTQLKNLGPFSYPEKIISLIFLFTVLAWVFQPLLKILIPQLTDAGIAMLASLLLFVIPARCGHAHQTIIDWQSMRELPWGTLLLIGGGMSLASTVGRSGLTEWIALNMQFLQGIPDIFILLICVLIAMALTEFTSNVAVTAALLPIVASISTSLSKDPLFLVIPVSLATSCAFMLPVATPPNSIVFGSGMLKISQMLKTGFWLNLIFIPLIALVAYFLVPVVLAY